MIEKPLAYISAPGFNEPQRTGMKKLLETVQGAGYETYIPTLTRESPPREEVEPHLAALQNSAVVVAWLDGLNDKGVSIFEVTSIEKKLDASLDEDQMDALALGMERHPKFEKVIKEIKKQKGLSKKILTPGELQRGVQIKAADLGLTAPQVDLAAQGRAVVRIKAGPLNFPDASTVFEMGYAFAARKPVFALALADPIIGMYLGWTPSVTCDRFDALGKALEMFKLHDGIPFPDLMAQIRKEHGVDLLSAPEPVEIIG